MKLNLLACVLCIPYAYSFQSIPSTSISRGIIKASNSNTNTLSHLSQLYSEVETDSETYNEVESEDVDLLQSILIKASSSDRGQYATDEEKSNIENMITQMEKKANSLTSPTFSSNIQGTWELLYSNTQLFRSSPFFLAGRGVCKTEEQAKQYDWFCDMHRAALAISNIGKVRQIISETRMISEFEVKVGSVPFLSDFVPFAYSGGLPFTIEGAIVSSADITATSDGTGWEIYMDTVEIKGSNIPLLRSVLDNGLKLESRELASFLEENVSSYTTPRPIFKTTYLDEDIRISRDQDGKVFVYGKVSNDVVATDYSGIDSDLGLTKLWDGFQNSILS